MSTRIELLQHALGINARQREPLRNYFLSSAEHSDNPAWLQLVAEGYAVANPAPGWSCGDVIYRVTEAGQAVAIAALPETKKRTRYDDYLHSEVCESFGEWLGIELPVYEEREISRYKWEYRMVRRSRGYDTYYDVVGEWKPTQKAAKASYKAALKASREAIYA